MIFWVCVIAALLAAALIGYYVLGLVLVCVWAGSYFMLSSRYGKGRTAMIGSLMFFWVFCGGLVWTMNHDLGSVLSCLSVVGATIWLNAPWIYANKP